MRKTVDDFWAWVQERMDSLDIPSIRQLEIRADLANGAISKRLNDLKLPTVEMAEGLCKALRVSWCELWDHAGYMDHITVDADTNPVVYECYKILLQLSSRQQEDIMYMLRGLARPAPEGSRGETEEGAIVPEGATRSTRKDELSSATRFELFNRVVDEVCITPEKLQLLADFLQRRAELCAVPEDEEIRSREVEECLQQFRDLLERLHESGGPK